MKDDDQNPYAPPRSDVAPQRRAGPRDKRSSNAGVTAWQDDGRIVMPAFGGELPDRCVVCNTPTDYKRKTTFQWHSPGYYFLICVGWVVYLIALFIVRKTATVYLGLCDEHEARRKSGVTITWIGVGLGVLLLIVGGNVDSPGLMLFAAAGMLVALIVGAQRTRVARVWKIDESHIWLTAGPEFVRSLPDSPDGDETEAASLPATRKRMKKRARKPGMTVDDELRAMLEDLPEETPEGEPAPTPEGNRPATPDEKSAEDGDDKA